MNQIRNDGPSIARWVGQWPVLLGSLFLSTVAQAGPLVAWGDNAYHQTNIPVTLTNAVGAAGGYNHVLALRVDGTVTAWGSNTDNQTNVPSGLANVLAISAGLYHNLALGADHGVTAWGRSSSGQTAVPANLSNVVQVAAGWYFSLALRADGTVAAWGDNTYSQTNVPARVTNVVAIAAGGMHALALHADGTVTAWGAGTNKSGTAQNYGQSMVPNSATNVVAIAAGGQHSLGLRRDGTVVAWGAGTSNTGVAPQYGQAIVPAGLSDVAGIAAGMQHSLALRSDGSVVAWGAGTNSTGTAPNYGQSSVPAGLSNVLTVAAGPNFSLALSAPGLLLWPQPPVALALAANASVTLNVGVISRTPYTCHWSLNGLPLDGETATSLEVVAFDLTKCGAYTLAVSNETSSASATTVLRLTNSPVILIDGTDVGGGNLSRIDSFRTTMSSTFGSGAHIYYTLDGTQPDFTSSPYSVQFATSNSVILRSVAYNDAYTESVEAAPIVVQVWPTYPLLLSSPGGGSASASPAPYEAGNRYISNTVVTLTATQAVGWSFLHWSGDNTNATNVTTLVMDQAQTVQAIFGTSPNFTVNGSGQLVVDPPAGPYPFGSTLRLQALPADGAYFFGWGGAATGFTNPLTLALTNPAPVSALFGQLKSNQVSLTVAVNGYGAVTFEPAKNVYTNGETVKLTAVTGTSNVFTSWSGDVTDTLNPLTLVLDSSKLLTANFSSGSRTNVPQITQPPLSRTLRAGAATLLSVQAVGDGPLYYQWRFNGTSMSGATVSSLTLSQFNAAQAGNYDVVVTGAAGSATSQVASVALFQLEVLPSSFTPLPLLILNGAKGSRFQLETSADLADTNWTLLAPVTLPSAVYYYLDTPASNHSQRYYRAVPQ